MNHNEDFIGELEDYLAAFDGVTALPDRVRNAVRAELPSARQVRPRPGPERVLTMLSNTSGRARLGLAAAAVVVAVVLGGALLNNGNPKGVVGGGQTPTPAAPVAPTLVPTSAPTAAPTVAAGPTLLDAASYVACDGADLGKNCLPAGTYQLSGGSGVWPVMVTIDVPAGWFEWEGGVGWDAVLVNDGPPSYDGSGWGLIFTTVGKVFRDPCDRSNGSIAASDVDTPQKLAAAITAWPGFSTTPAKPINVDGHSALELNIARKANSALCGSGQAWLSSDGATVDAYPFVNGPTYPTTIRIIDTGRGLLVLRASDFPNTSPFEIEEQLTNTPSRHTADQPALHAILDSVRLIVPPASS
jgi:hypothetical protein